MGRDGLAPPYPRQVHSGAKNFPSDALLWPLVCDPLKHEGLRPPQPNSCLRLPGVQQCPPLLWLLELCEAPVYFS